VIRVGVLGTANIAERRMIPAIKKCNGFEYVCAAVSSREETGEEYSEEDFFPLRQRKEKKAAEFVRKFGGQSVCGYGEMLKRTDIDAVYIPLPPALHFRWAMEALRHGKHILVEKPFSTCVTDTRRVIEEAQKRGLSVMENYGFCFHEQVRLIRQMIAADEIGELRLIRASFGFPHRDSHDFRYAKKMGGGALLDCGGYTLKAASVFLGDDARIVDSSSVITKDHEVDVFGTASLRGKNGLTAQVSYGMDHYYKCELEIWGSKGCLSAPRIFTAPDGFPAPVLVRTGDGTKELFAGDDQFLKVVERFRECMEDDSVRKDTYREIIRQSVLVDNCKNGEWYI
jgi:Predicted dehydrogenases and related proteins